MALLGRLEGDRPPIRVDRWTGLPCPGVLCPHFGHFGSKQCGDNLGVPGAQRWQEGPHTGARRDGGPVLSALRGKE